MTVSLLGVDASLTGTGYAVIHYRDGHWTGSAWTRGRKGHRNESLEDRDERLSYITSDLHCVDLGGLTAAGIEQPLTNTPGGSSWDRAGLWWRLVHRLLVCDVPVVEVNSAKRQKFAVGKSSARGRKVEKHAVLEAVRVMWPMVKVEDDNAADALVVASVIAVLYELPVPFGMTDFRHEVVSGLRLPGKEAA
jgi:crossover junction endodeoxyribonuclease RuvC